jgi:hypothetical protein
MLRPSAIPTKDAAAKTLAGVLWRIKRRLRQMEPGITPGMKNFWESLCVQVQTDGAFTEGYKDIVLEEMKTILANLPIGQRFAIWLETDDGGWVRRDRDVHGLDELLHLMDEKAVQSHIMDSVLYEAMNYSNARTRAITEQ